MNTEHHRDKSPPMWQRLFLQWKQLPWWCLIAVVVLTLCFFAKFIFLGEHIAFRDGAHFYPALFEYIQTEWEQGRPPLWNPYENLGQPLMANPVSSVFYPMKLVYFLPLPAYMAYHLYVIGHLLLAALTCYRLARHWQASVFAASIAAVSYAFGGNVLFQYSNVVFLVGAAWLPEAIHQANKLLTKRHWHSVITLGIVFAMLVLGGDLQAAYNAIVLIGLLILFYHWSEKRSISDSRLSIETTSVLQMLENTSTSGSFDANRQTPARLFFKRISLLLIALVLGGFLSAVQILPTLEFGFQSDRVLEDKPVSAWGAISELERGYREHDHNAWQKTRDGMLCRPEKTTGIAQVRYDFSVGPWRFVEYLWPNASGRLFPINTNWGSAIKWQSSQPWVPSLYMGIVAFLLAIAAVRFRKSDPITLWLSWSCLIFVLGSLGYFGLGWVINQIIVLCNGSPQASGLGNPFGGVYWLFQFLFPGYAQFRYPAKLLAVASLLMAMLSARSFDSIFGVPHLTETIHNTRLKYEQRKRLKSLVMMMRLLILVSFILIPLVLVPMFWVKLEKQIPIDPIFGRFVPDRALGEAAFSLMHVINVLFIFLVLARIYSKKIAKIEHPDVSISLDHQNKAYHRYFYRFGIGVLLVVCCDLFFSNAWLVATAKHEIFDGRPQLASMLHMNAPLDSRATFLQNDNRNNYIKGNMIDLDVDNNQSDNIDSNSTENINNTAGISDDRKPSDETDVTTLTPPSRKEKEQTDQLFDDDFLQTIPLSYPVRVWRAPTYMTRNEPWFPVEFRSPSSNRLAEWVIWERTTMVPRYPLTQGIAISDVRGTVVTTDYYVITHILRGAWGKPNVTKQDRHFFLTDYLASIGNSAMIVPNQANRNDYFRDEAEHVADVVSTDTVSNDIEPVADMIAIDHTDQNSQLSDDPGEITELRDWGSNNITHLLPSEMACWELQQEPRVILSDRIVIEPPVLLKSRDSYFQKTFGIIAQCTRTGVPVVEVGSESFERLPPRFIKAFAKLIANGERHFDHWDEKTAEAFPKMHHAEVGETMLVSYEPNRVVIKATMCQPGMLILCDQYDKNWRTEVRPVPPQRPQQIPPHMVQHMPPKLPPSNRFAPPSLNDRLGPKIADGDMKSNVSPHHDKSIYIDDQKRFDKHRPPAFEVPIFRTNRILRGIPLPEGEWEVTFVYYQFSFRLGATISFFVWAALIMFLIGTITQKLQRRKRKNRSKTCTDDRNHING